ncbi:MAG: methanogenesis marker 12 protein [Methanosphaera sp.]|nr:methanogenesis marker 12 protein [Methanosphaera sp.]
MKYYVGMDHGTTAISFSIIDTARSEVSYFKLNREDLANNKVSFKNTLTEHVDISDIELLAMTYAMGDNISSIMPLEKVVNRGIKSINGAGRVTGGGSSVYSDIESMNIPAVLIPGLHRECEFLDKRFRASYSHCASSEKVSLSYYAYKKYGYNNMIIADISSNTVCILVENGVIRGAIDACIGAMGFIHGPIDLSMIRDIDENKCSANECFSHAGISKIAHVDSSVSHVKDDILEKAVNGDEDALLAIDSLVMSVVMEIYGLYGVSNKNIDAIILTGSGGVMSEPIDISGKIKVEVENLAPVEVMSDHSGSLGSAYIAMDVANNYSNIMGINVEK